MMLKDMVAIITGASRGIGAQTAILFAAEGALVVVNFNRNEAAAQKVVDEITSNDGKAIAIQADVTDAGQVERMMEIVL